MSFASEKLEAIRNVLDRSAMLREHATKWDTLTFHGMRVSELDLTIEQSRRNW